MSLVVVPVRYPLSRHSKATLAEAIRIAEERDADLTVLHVDLYQEGREVTRTELKRAVEAEFGRIDRARYVVRRGFLVEETILDEESPANDVSRASDRPELRLDRPLEFRPRHLATLLIEVDVEDRQVGVTLLGDPDGLGERRLGVSTERVANRDDHQGHVETDGRGPFQSIRFGRTARPLRRSIATKRWPGGRHLTEPNPSGGQRSLLVFEFERDRDLRLILAALDARNLDAEFVHLDPLHVVQRLLGAVDGVVGRLVEALRTRSDQCDLLEHHGFVSDVRTRVT